MNETFRTLTDEELEALAAVLKGGGPAPSTMVLSVIRELQEARRRQRLRDWKAGWNE